jgi:PiT family inorganic phosphate transporter
MSDAILAPPGSIGQAPSGKPKLDRGMHPGGIIAFLLVLVAGLSYAVVSLITDMNAVHQEPLAIGAFVLLGLALLIALGFEFVNGFHDTANAVATVIYTHSLPPLVAVIWSGAFNFLGVMLSSGAVAYAIVTLLPVELILQVGSGAGYAMIFALLLAAIIWNLGTWAFGLPNSSSHALIGSVLGVGLANQLMGGQDGTSGVDWAQALNVFKALLFSPVCGFVLAALLLLALKFAVRRKDLYEAPKGDTPPPLWIRGLLILTCTLVSFFHGGNDGQKGMGLIMLILIGAAPTAYALNRTMSADATPAFVQTSQAASAVFAGKIPAASRASTRPRPARLSRMR